MMRFVADRELILSIAASGKAYVEKRFTSERNAREIAELYGKLLNE